MLTDGPPSARDAGRSGRALLFCTTESVDGGRGVAGTATVRPGGPSANAAVPGALDFWRRFPGAVQVHDARPDPWSTVHFEIDPDALTG